MVIDDDVVRVRSRNFEMETGMPLVNNPEKGMGAVQNVCVAMPSGFFLGSHFSLKGQGAKEAVKIILLDLAGRGVVLQEQMHGRITNGTGLDRGYQQEDLLHTMNDWAVPVVGTLKRCKFAPFTFGEGSRRYAHQLYVPTNGPRLDFWAVQQFHDSKGRRIESYAGVHRNGLGKCFMTHTTMPKYQPYKYTVTRTNASEVDTLIPPHFREHMPEVMELTCDQRTPTWFMLREFVFTSTAAYGVFRMLSRVLPHVPQPGPEVATHLKVIALFGITRHTNALGEYDLDVEEIQDISGETQESLYILPRAQLVLLCKQRHLPYSGNKAELVKRLLSHEVMSVEAGDVYKDLFKCWFLEPIRSESMKIGCQNEPNIFRRIPEVFHVYQTEWLAVSTRDFSILIHELLEPGLLCLKPFPYVGTTPDGLALITRVGIESTMHVMCIEMKTVTTETTIMADVNLASVYGTFCYVDILNDELLFKKVIPKTAHRVQCVHHIVSTNTQYCLYVVADSGACGIIRMVLIHVPSGFKQVYISIFNKFAHQFMSWVHGNPRTPLPEFTADQLGYLQSRDVLELHVALWTALMVHVQHHGPIANVHAIVPSIVSLWNLVKNGGDLYSSLLNHIKPDHKKINPRAKIWLRGLGTLFYQVYQCERLWMTMRVLRDPMNSFETYSKVRKAVTSKMQKFGNVVREMASCFTLDMFMYCHPAPHHPQPNQETTPVVDMTSDHPSIHITYKKMDVILKSSTLSAKREDVTFVHASTPMEKDVRLRCVLCCSRCSFGNGMLRARDQAHTRLGHVTRYQCSECTVPLCRQKRLLWQGIDKSCMEIFHDSTKEELAILKRNMCATADPAFSEYAQMIAAELPQKSHRVIKPAKKVAVSLENNMVGTPSADIPPKTKPRKKRVQKLCEFHECTTWAGFSYTPNPPRFCKKHKLEGMTRFKFQKPAPTFKQGSYKKKHIQEVCGACSSTSGTCHKHFGKITVPVGSPVLMQISTNPARGGAHNLEQEPVRLRVKGSKKKKGAYKRLKFSTDALAHAQQPVSGQSHDMPVPSQNHGSDLAPAELVTATFSVCQFEDCCEKAIYGFDTTGEVFCALHRAPGMDVMSV